MSQKSKPYVIALALLWALPAALFGLAYQLSSHRPPTGVQCNSQVFFGCQSAADHVGLLALLAVPVFGVLGLIAVAAIAIYRAISARRSGRASEVQRRDGSQGQA